MPPLLLDTSKLSNVDFKASTLMLGQSQEPSLFAETPQGQEVG